MVRRTISTSVVATFAALTAGAVLLAAAPSQTPLRELADAHEIAVGSAVGTGPLDNDAFYRSTLGREFSSVTAENAMKWKFVQPEPGPYDWSAADDLVSFAEQHDQRVYGHTLVWHQGSPQWLVDAVEAGEYTDEELRELLRTHITEQVRHFGTKVWAWDVVNEVFEDDGSLRPSIWLDALGPDYITDSFRWAHQANPEAKLFINDYNIEWIGAKSDALYDLVADLKSQGVPIHGVGFQTHRTNRELPADYQENLQRFADLDLDVAVTEMDVRIELPADDADLETQAEVYADAVQACLAVSRCVSYSVWGFSDKYSWIPSTFPGYGAGHLYDENDATKPAYHAVSDALS